MPLKIIHPDHFEIVGRGIVLLSNPPSFNASADTYTGKLVEEIALLSKAHAIIAKEPKAVDTAKGQLTKSEFNIAIRRLCEDHGIKCVLAIAGKKEPGIEIRTLHTDESTKEMIELVRAGFAADFDVKITSRENTTDDVLSVQSKSQLITLELGSDERGYKRDEIVATVTDSVSLINAKLGHSENPSDTLD